MFCFTTLNGTPLFFKNNELPLVRETFLKARKESMPEFKYHRKSAANWLQKGLHKSTSQSRTLDNSNATSTEPSMSQRNVDSSLVMGLLPATNFYAMNISKPPINVKDQRKSRDFTMSHPENKENIPPTINLPKPPRMARNTSRTYLKPLHNTANNMIRTHSNLTKYERIQKPASREQLVEKYFQNAPLSGWAQKEFLNDETFEILYDIN